MVHLGIIPDGNRRWCKENNKTYTELVGFYFDKIITCLLETYPQTFLKNEKYTYLTHLTEFSIYLSSIDNFKREDKTYELAYDVIERLYREKNRIKDLDLYFTFFKLNVVGDRDLIPPKINEILDEMTAQCTGGFVVNIAVMYDPEKDMKGQYLREQSNLDMVIRTGKEKRLSGFFPTKTLYAELFFYDKFWPDFTIEDINAAVGNFTQRNRRFGK